MTHYEVMGLTRKARLADVKRAYKRLARKHHPDLNPGDRRAEETFKSISEAYSVLGDPARRVGMRVDQPRHQRPLPHIQLPGTIRARLRRISDVADDPVLHQDRRALAGRCAGAVKQPRAGQPQPAPGRGRVRHQCREPMCHAGTAPPRIFI